jgi:hypothetical protein
MGLLRRENKWQRAIEPVTDHVSVPSLAKSGVTAVVGAMFVTAASAVGSGAIWPDQAHGEEGRDQAGGEGRASSRCRLTRLSWQTPTPPDASATVWFSRPTSWLELVAESRRTLDRIRRR